MEVLLPFAFPIGGFLLTLLLTPLVRMWGLRRGWVDRPVGGRKIHRTQVVRPGGLAFWAATAVGVAGWIWGVHAGLFSDSGWSVESVLTVFGAASIVAAVGWYDDAQPCPAWVKLSAQGAAALLVVHAGLVLQGIVNPFTGEYLAFGLIGYPMTVLWILLMINSVNLIDGLDGLAGGVSVFALTALCATGFLPHPAVLITLTLLGALFGFLRYNLAPAVVFMGDTGSTFVGFMIGAIALLGMTAEPTINSLLATGVILGFPILDTVLAFTRRLLSGRHPFRPDAEHLHHRLFRLLGRLQARAVWVIYMISLTLGFLGFTIAIADSMTALFLTGGVLLGALSLLVLLDYLRPSGEQPHLTHEMEAPAQRLLIAPPPPALVLTSDAQTVLQAVLADSLDETPEMPPDETWEPMVAESVAVAPVTAEGAVEAGQSVNVEWVSLSVMNH